MFYTPYTQSMLDAYNEYLSLKEKQYIQWASKLKYLVALFSEVSEQGPVVGHMPMVAQHSEAEAEKLLWIWGLLGLSTELSRPPKATYLEIKNKVNKGSLSFQRKCDVCVVRDFRILKLHLYQDAEFPNPSRVSHSDRCHIPLTAALRRQRQEDYCKQKANQGYMVTSSQ